MSENETPNGMDDVNARRLIEALLLVSDKPLPVAQIREVVPLEPSKIRELTDSWARELEETGRGFRVKEIAGGYQLVTDPELAGALKVYFTNRERRRLTQAGLETLSIIAYRQPLTKAEIEFIRGVNVDASLKTLLEKGLIRITGRKEVPGRPLLYGTTPGFLDHFGLASVKELPKLAEFTEKDIELPEHLKHSTDEIENQETAPAAAPSEVVNEGTQEAQN